MQESSLFIGLAQIAGVFVGFAALISATRKREASTTATQMLVGAGLIVIVAALVPIALASYGIRPEWVWRASAVAFLAIIWVGWGLSYVQSTARENLSGHVSETSNLTVGLWLVLELGSQIPLAMIVLGLQTHLSAALYSTALIACLLQAAINLAQLVLSPPDSE